MKYAVGSCIFVFLATVQGGVQGFRWTSGPTLPDNSTVPICGGQDLTLAWDYRTDSSEQVVNVEWRFQSASGTTEDVLATQVNGHFFADPSVHQRLEYIPGAGIRLFNATDEYSGTYTVRVNLNAQGSIQMLSQSVNIVVSNESVATSDRLQAQQAGARFLPEDQQHHILLTCGHFNPLWQPSVEIVWTDPHNRTLSSTTRENGQFVLAVPNPVLDGPYACHIDDNSPAARCLASDSPLRGGATVQLDSVQAAMALVASELQRLQQQLQLMVPELQSLQTNHSLLLQQFNILLAQRNSLGSQLQVLTAENQNLTAVLHSLTHTPAGRSVRSEAAVASGWAPAPSSSKTSGASEPNPAPSKTNATPAPATALPTWGSSASPPLKEPHKLKSTV